MQIPIQRGAGGEFSTLMDNVSGNAAASRAVLQLAWPLASVMLGETLMGLVDVKLVGGLGTGALGGVGLANAALYFTNISVLGLMRGVKVCTAHAAGRGAPQDGRKYADVGFILGLVVGSFFALGICNLAPVLRGLGIGQELVAPAHDYLVARAWGLPATCALAALMEHRQGMGEVRSSLWVGLCGNVLNAFLAYGFIHGRWGLPQLGVFGAGIGTSITETVQLFMMLTVMALSGRPGPLGQGYGLAPSQLRRGPALREVTYLGLPTALHFGFEYLAFAACTAILATFSDIDVAAHQIAVVVNRLAYLPGLAIGEVACILVSNALGAGRVQEAECSARAALRLAIWFMVACGFGLAVFGGTLARFITPDATIARLTAQVLLVAGLFQVVEAVNIVMRGALRGARDVRMAAFLGVAILWSVVPTLTFLLGRVLGWGAVGGWCSFTVESALCAAIYTWRWRHGAWRVATQKAVPAPVSPMPVLVGVPASH